MNDFLKTESIIQHFSMHKMSSTILIIFPSWYSQYLYTSSVDFNPDNKILPGLGLNPAALGCLRLQFNFIVDKNKHLNINFYPGRVDVSARPNFPDYYFCF